MWATIAMRKSAAQSSSRSSQQKILLAQVYTSGVTAICVCALISDYTRSVFGTAINRFSRT